ncbi:MAG: HAD family hydrolase [Planctomycetes bacterium]|nr:HAD family hydrolase [Planctomycetota bacterium]
MSEQRIEAVLFDLGETLLTFGRLDRARLFAEAAHRSYAYLKEQAQPVGSYGAYRLFYLWGIRWHVLKSWLTGNDFNSLELLKQYGKRKGFTLTADQWEELNWQWYKGLAEAGGAKAGTKDAMQRLEQMGLKLGLLSNTFIHKSCLERHLAEDGLLEHLPVRLYTYDFPWRKPDVRIFQEAAKAMGIAPQHIIYVGDRIDNDIEGASKAGMLPVLVKAYTNENKTIPADVAFIQTITELPEMIKKIACLDDANEKTGQAEPVCNSHKG